MCLWLLFARGPSPDMVTEALAIATENNKKSVVALSIHNRPLAKTYSAKALDSLGLASTFSTVELWIAVCWQVLRQGLHRVWVGRAVEMALMARQPHLSECTVEAAVAYHRLHQLTVQEASAPDGSDPHFNGFFNHTSRCPEHYALLALNLAETVDYLMEPLTLMNIYIAAAATCESLCAGGFQLATRTYLAKARTVYRAHPDKFPQIAWLFEPGGQKFFLSGRWWQYSGLDRGTGWFAGDNLPPGVVEQIGVSFRLEILAEAMQHFFSCDIEQAQDYLHKLEQVSVQAGDKTQRWWAYMTLVAVQWRLGNNKDANRFISLAEALGPVTNTLQQSAAAAFKAQQELLRGHHSLAWDYCEQSARLLRSLPLATGSGKGSPAVGTVPYQHLSLIARLLVLKQLVATRINLYRVRSLLSSQSGTLPPIHQTGVHDPEGVLLGEVSFDTILAGAQDDVAMLRGLSEVCVLATPAMMMFQGICRCLAGGRATTTEHLFNQALKGARRLNLLYEEASVLLQMSMYLRHHLSASVLHTNLSRAQELFQRLQASNDLAATQQLLQLIQTQ